MRSEISALGVKKIISLLVILSFLFPSIIFANNDFKEINLGKFEDISDFKYTQDGKKYGVLGNIREDFLGGSKTFFKNNDGNSINLNIPNFYYTKLGKLVYIEEKFIAINDEKSKEYNFISGFSFLENKEDFVVSISDNLGENIIKNLDDNGKRYSAIIDNVVLGSNYGFIGFNGDNNTYTININGEEVYTYTIKDIGNQSVKKLYISPTANNYALLVIEGGKSYMIINGEKSKGYDLIMPKGKDAFIFGNDGEHYAFVAEIHGTTKTNFVDNIIIKDGVEYKGYQDVSNISFSKNTNDFIFSGRKNGKQLFSKNFNDVIIGNNIRDLKISDNGENIFYTKNVYLGDRDADMLISNGIETKIYSSSKRVDNKDKYIFYSRNGENYIFVAEKNKKILLYINGNYIKNTYDEILNLVFSDTLKNYAFIGIKGKQKYLVLNDKEIDITNYYDNLIGEYGKQIFFADDWSKVGIIYKNSNGDSILLELDNSNIENTTNNTPIQETPKTTQANPQLDKILLPFFERTDKKGDEIAKNTYKTVISKLDVVLQKKLSVKNKNILNYLKEKLEEKIK